METLHNVGGTLSSSATAEEVTCDFRVDDLLWSSPTYSGKANITTTSSSTPATSTASDYAPMGTSTAYAPSTLSNYELSVLSSAPTPTPAFQSAYTPPYPPPSLLHHPTYPSFPTGYTPSIPPLSGLTTGTPS
jgi:hypothetical protein